MIKTPAEITSAGWFFSCHEPDLQGMFTKGWCNENNITGYPTLRSVPGRIGKRGRENVNPATAAYDHL
ncbi:hypothetical protein ENTKAS01_39380 [Enterobacter sp. AS-1]|nr:hypothetical protein ENTKAS01_39380 [Enterobacter sp. AS-1]